MNRDFARHQELPEFTGRTIPPQSVEGGVGADSGALVGGEVLQAASVEQVGLHPARFLPQTPPQPQPLQSSCL